MLNHLHTQIDGHRPELPTSWVYKVRDDNKTHYYGKGTTINDLITAFGERGHLVHEHGNTFTAHGENWSPEDNEEASRVVC